MGGFTKFDPRTFLGSEEPRPIHAKAAKLAKGFYGPDSTLATLATLEAHRAGCQNSAALPGDASAKLLAPLFKPMSPAYGEPGFSEPCASRIGRVEDWPDGPRSCTSAGSAARGVPMAMASICAQAASAAGTAPRIARKAVRHDPRDDLGWMLERHGRG